jgi:hypothetical protein
MNSFLSVLFFQTNPFSGEKLAGGLLIISPCKIWFGFSEAKIKWIKELSGESGQKLVAQVLKEIEQKVNEVNQTIAFKAPLLVKSNPFTEGYLQYLNTYSQGIVQFGALLPIAGEIDEAGFGELFGQFVGKEKPRQAKAQKTLPEILKKEGLSKKADVDFILKPGPLFQGVYTDTHISLVTKNGSLKAYQLIDFSEDRSKVLKMVEEFTLAAFALERFSKNKNWEEQPKFEILFGTITEDKIKQASSKNAVDAIYNLVKSQKPSQITLEEESKLEAIVEEVLAGAHSPLSEHLEEKSYP